MELQLAWDCERYHQLPQAGGVLDQPAGLLARMRAVANVYHAFRNYLREGKRPGSEAEWKKSHRDEWDLIRYINDLRKMHHG